MGTKKKALRDIARVVVSNLISLISGIMVGFIIPKLMGIDDYGYYKTYGLYAGYTGLLHFGIADGIYFYFSGQDINTLDKKKLHSAVSFVILLELSLSLVGLGISCCFITKTFYGLIFAFVFVYNLFSQVRNILSFVCQATKQFTFPSVVSSCRSLLDILCIAVLYLLSKYQNFQTQFWVYCVIVLATMGLESLSFVIKLWGIVFGEGQDKSQTKKDLILFLKLGFPLMIANLTSSLIMNVDKQFVSIFYPIETSNIFSLFSFAYSVLSLITAVTSAVSTVLFPYMKNKTDTSLCASFPTLNTALSVFVAIACSSFFCVQWVVDRYLPKYMGSISYFRIIIPGLLLNTCVTVLMHNYYKALNKERVYFWQNIIVLAFAILSDLLAYYFIVLIFDPMDPIWLTVASDVTLVLWYILSESYLVKHYKIKHWKNDIYSFAACGLFLIVAFFLNEWLGFAVYLGSSALLSIAFFSKDFKKMAVLLHQEKSENKSKG